MKKIENLREYLAKIDCGEKAYEFLTHINDGTIKGRHDFNENLYVNVVSYGTKDVNCFDGVFEDHKDFIDLHVIIRGEEKIFYGNRSDMVITKEYDKAGDYELLQSQNYSSVDYSEMQGIECAINEPHMAGYACGEKGQVLKAIVKIFRNIAK